MILCSHPLKTATNVAPKILAVKPISVSDLLNDKDYLSSRANNRAPMRKRESTSRTGA
jgi:hypothetical protein